ITTLQGAGRSLRRSDPAAAPPRRKTNHAEESGSQERHRAWYRQMYARLGQRRSVLERHVDRTRCRKIERVAGCQCQVQLECNGVLDEVVTGDTTIIR